MISIKDLTHKVKKILKKDVYFSNLWKGKGKTVCLGIYDWGESLSFRSFYQGHIVMDLSGKVLSIVDQDQPIRSLNSLIGKNIDLRTMDKYKKEVKSRPVGVESADVLGEVIDSGKVVLYTKKNFDIIKFPKTYDTNNQKGWDHYRNYPAADTYKEILKKYKQKVSSFYIHDDSATTYYFEVDINKDISISVKLWRFFSYELTVRVYKGEDLLVSLKNSEASQLEAVLNEVISGTISNETRLKSLISRNRQLKNYSNLRPTGYEEFSFSANVKDLRTKYIFKVNFKTNKVSCVNMQKNNKTVPLVVKRLNQEFKELSI